MIPLNVYYIVQRQSSTFWLVFWLTPDPDIRYILHNRTVDNRHLVCGLINTDEGIDDIEC